MVPVPPFFLAVPVLAWAPRCAVSSSESWVVPWTPTGLSGPIPPFPKDPSVWDACSFPPCLPRSHWFLRSQLGVPGLGSCPRRRSTPCFLSTLVDKRTLREPRRTDGEVQRYLFFRPHFGGRIKPFADAPNTSQLTEPPRVVSMADLPATTDRGLR